MDEGNLVVLFNAFQKKTQKNAAMRDRTGKTNYERIFQEKGGFAT